MTAPKYLTGKSPLTPEQSARIAQDFANMNTRPVTPMNDRIAAVAYWAVVLIAFGTAGLVLVQIAGVGQ